MDQHSHEDRGTQSCEMMLLDEGQTEEDEDDPLLDSPDSPSLPCFRIRNRYLRLPGGQEYEHGKSKRKRCIIIWSSAVIATLIVAASLALILSATSSRSRLLQSKTEGSSQCTSDFSRQGQHQAVKCHFARAKERAAKLSNQSQTIEAASEEYLRRYHRKPPPGFDGWFGWSRKNNVRIIDDYDSIEASLLQFRHLSSVELTAALTRVLDQKKPLVTISVKDGKVDIPGNQDTDHIRSMHTLLDPIAAFLPDLQFVLNWDDNEALRGPVIDAAKENKDPKKLDHQGASDAWTFVTASCPVSHLSPNSFIDRPEIDLCNNIDNSALVHSRGDLQGGAGGISNLVPIMSWSKYSTSRDILVPHWAYNVAGFRGWNREVVQLPFAEKKHDLYWRGSTTGGSMRAAQWRQNYRVQFVQYITSFVASLKKLRRTAFNFEDVQLSSLGMEDSPSNREMMTKGLNDTFFDVGFTATVQCDESHIGCDDLKKNLAIVSGADSIHEQEHRYLWDMDGNSMSGRFYRLLSTGSLVFKQTLLGEWHDDRLTPWYHYVPITFTSKKDIPQLLDFFSNTDNGRSIAREIATQGRLAVESTLRSEDLSSFWYRLLMEYSSLFYQN